MGTKKTSTTTNNYDPQSMNRYQGWANSMMPQLQNLFSNPFSSPFFNLNMQQTTKGASALAGRNMSNALLNFGRTGVGSGLSTGGMRNSLLNQLQRQGSGMQYAGFMGAVNQAQSDRWNAASLGSNLFSNPLQTGQKNVQQTSGLGTWLPQLAGAALAIGGAPFTGGASLGALGSGFFKGANSGPDTGQYIPGGTGSISPFMTSGVGGNFSNPGFVPGGTGGINPWTMPTAYSGGI